MPTTAAKANFAYKASATVLDPPHMATAPVLLAGYVLAHHSFIVVWNTPTAATSNSMSNGAITPMTFAAHDGSTVVATVKVSSATIGSLLIATLTVLSQIQVTR